MKQTLISRLIVGALATAAAGSAFAGQIQASSLSIAREVITTDTQAINAPSITYRFAGDVNATAQNQTFQVQFTLQGGATWKTAGDKNSIAIVPQAGANAGTAATVDTHYTVDALALSADKTTLFATITVLTGTPFSNMGQPQFTISNAATKPTVDNLFKVVGTIAECDDAVKTLKVDVKHYTALTSPGSLATDANATPDEHLRPGAANQATLITFPTNIKVSVTKALGDAKLDVSAGSVKFAGTANATVTSQNAGSFIDANHAFLGSVGMVQNATGYDADLASQYLLADNTAPAGVKGIATAAENTGKLELEKFSVKITASQGFVEGGKVYLVKLPADAGLLNAAAAAEANAIGGAGQVVTIAANTGKTITLTVPAANINAAFGASGAERLAVIYKNPGNVIIPGSSFYIDEARADKAAAGTDLNEQDNYCKGAIYPLSGSIKIDVKNYAANARTDGWMSVLRVINPSETRTIDVYGQYIHADGMYGKWGKLGQLKPRAVVQWLPNQVDAALTNAPAHATSANNATAALPTTGDAPRLRITSENGDTLRVQNYLFNPASGNFIEVSGSQGVDFTGSADRAPASEGQYQEQDAQVGLNGGN